MTPLADHGDYLHIDQVVECMFFLFVCLQSKMLYLNIILNVQVVVYPICAEGAVKLQPASWLQVKYSTTSSRRGTDISVL